MLTKCGLGSCNRKSFGIGQRRSSSLFMRVIWRQAVSAQYFGETGTDTAVIARDVFRSRMSAVHFVSADAPSDSCEVIRRCKFFTLTLLKVCSDKVQRVANWHCMTHGLQGAILMEFESEMAVVDSTEWVISAQQRV